MSGTRSGGAGSSPRLAQMRADAVAWCSEVAGQRACRPLDGAARPRCSPPSRRRALAAAAGGAVRAGHLVERARIGPDIHAKVGGTLYSVPWRAHRRTASTSASTDSMVQFFHHGQLIKTHPRKDRGKQTDLGDYPPEKIAFHMRTPTWCRRQAAEHRPGLRRR